MPLTPQFNMLAARSGHLREISKSPSLYCQPYIIGLHNLSKFTISILKVVLILISPIYPVLIDNQQVLVEWSVDGNTFHAFS